MPKPIMMKKGDRLPSLKFWLEAPEALTAPDSVAFRFEPAGGAGSASGGAASVLEVTNGRVLVQYDWGATDTTTVGRFRAEFVATYSGKEITFPNGEPQFLDMVVYDDVT